MAPEVFVLIPCYNLAPYLSEAIESVIAQTWRDWELLILDDCSTDNSVSIAEVYASKDPRIRVIRNEANLGMVNNWNKGITYCRSAFFIKLDGDDYWHPEMIASALTVLNENESVAMVFSNYVNINERGEMDGVKNELPEFARNKSFSCFSLVQQGSSKMLSYSVLRQGLSLIRFSVFDKIGDYHFLLSKQTQAASDTEFYFRVGCHFHIYCIDRVLYYYRIHRHSISATDHARGLSQLKIFELKIVINNYYRQEGKISKVLWSRNNDETQFQYTLFLAHSHRTQRNVTQALFWMGKLIVLFPFQSLKHFWNRSFAYFKGNDGF